MNILQQKAQTALLKDTHTKESAIEVVNNHGIITLSGNVTALETREAAEAVVKTVNSVTTVVNEIQVRAEDKSNFDISGSFKEDVIVE